MNEIDKFIKLRDEFSLEFEKALHNLELSAWYFYINSSEKNMKDYEKCQNDYSKLFCNKKMYEQFKSIECSKLNAHEQKQLKKLLRNFETRLNSGDLFKAIEQKENEISKKYNSYIPKIDNCEFSKTEISKILQTETDELIRLKAYNAMIRGGDLIAKDLIELIKLRNQFAKTKNYNNFFDYQLKEEFDVNTDFLKNLINEVYNGSKNKIKNILESQYKELKETFRTDKLEGFHYGLLTNSDPSKNVNKILETTDIEQIVKNTYYNMGYDIDKYIEHGNITLDLYPRKGKNTHGFCFGITPGKDSRILANLRNDTNSIDTLMHELGHCVYDLGIDTSLPIVDRQPASSAFTEAIAMLMGDLQKKEKMLSKILPDKLLNEFMNTHIKDEINFISKSLLIIDFERELYQNPSGNCPEKWKELRIKYRNQPHSANNEWATIPHYLSHPAYYQNYFRANLMKVQIYNYLRSELGPITQNKHTAEYLNTTIFKKGASLDEYELIKLITGKEFGTSEFLNSI